MGKNRRRRLTLGAAALTGVAAVAAAAVPGAGGARPADHPRLVALGTYASGLGADSAETSAVDRGLLFATNSGDNSLDIVDIADPANPDLIRRVSLAEYGDGPNSVDAHGRYVAVAVEADPPTAPGSVVLLERDGTHVATVRVGALPDMLAFSPDGRRIVVANEGEPDGYGRPDSVDPQGTVSIIDTRAMARRRPGAVRTVTFTDFNAGGPRHDELPAGIRLNGPGASVAQDIEPEYVAFDALRPGRVAVTLQENNAVAFINLARARVGRIAALGAVDHSQPGSGFDASDRDGRINIANWPVRGMPMPDAIAGFRVAGRSYWVTANEGDARDYDGFTDEARVSSLTLDPTAFPDAATLAQSANVGRLNVSLTDGAGSAGHTRLHSFGTRSMSVWDARGRRVGDTGDAFERAVAATVPAAFNADNTSTTFDTLSDNKGPEPEGVDTGVVRGRTYAFVGLERIGGVMLVDVSRPDTPTVLQWANTRDFSAPAAPDSGPEVVRFVPGASSPTGRPLVTAANEVSGTVTIFAVR